MNQKTPILSIVCFAAWELLDAIKACEHLREEDLIYAKQDVTLACSILRKALYQADEVIIAAKEVEL